MAVKIGDNAGAAKQLKWHQLLIVRLLSMLMGLWTRTLRFRWGADVQAVIDVPPPPSVVILWHNRLFVAPAFFRRNFSRRQLAVLISASGDGAWLAAFLARIGMRPVRGSRYNRGPQAVRQLTIRADTKQLELEYPDRGRLTRSDSVILRLSDLSQ